MKTNINKLILNLITFILLIFLVYSQFSADLNDKDYGDPYKINYALENNPDSVDYSKVIYSDPYLDYDLLKYEKIPPDKFTELDGLRVDYHKLFQAIGRKDLSMEINNHKLGLEKTSSGEIVIAHPRNPDKRIFLNYLPSSSLLIVTEDEIEIHVPSKASNIDTSKIGSGVIITLDEATLYDGTKFSGRLSIENGELFVRKGDTLIFDNLNINTKDSDVGINTLVEGNGIILTENTIEIKGNDFDVDFLAGNRYVNVNPTENDIFSITPLGGTVSVENRQALNRVPLITIKGATEKESWAIIKNGIYKIEFGSKGVIEMNTNEFLSDVAGSVPSEIQVLDKDGNPIKLSLNNENNLLVLQPDAVMDLQGNIQCSGTSTSKSLTGITGEGVVGAIGKFCDLVIEFFGGNVPTVRSNELYIKHLKNKYGVGVEISGLSPTQTEQVLDKINNVLGIYRREAFEGRLEKIVVKESHLYIGGRADYDELNVYYFPFTVVGYGDYILNHEIAHFLTETPYNEEGHYSPNDPLFFGDYQEYLRRSNIEKQLYKKGEIPKFESSDTYYEKNRLLSKYNWVLGEYSYPTTVTDYLKQYGVMLISELKIKTPAGFVSGYAKTNYQEDVAETFTYVATHTLDDIKKLSAQDSALKEKLDYSGKAYIMVTTEPGKEQEHPWYNYFFREKTQK